MPIAIPYLEELDARVSAHCWNHRDGCRCVERWKRTKQARSLRAQYAAVCRWAPMR